MVRVYIGAQTQTVWAPETGYGTGPQASKFCFGYVQEHSPTENENYTPYRYVGAAGDRAVKTFVAKGQEFTGRVSLISQVPNLWHFAFGKIATAGSPVSTRTITESGTLPSFGIEDAQESIANESLKRTMNGCKIDSYTWKWNEAEPIEEEINYSAQSVSFSSGAATTTTQCGSQPYMWSMIQFNLSGGGMNGCITETKSGHFRVKQNLITAHYVGQSGANIGFPSRAIGEQIPGPLDYEGEIVANMAVGTGADMYWQLYRGGSEFNANLFIFRTSGLDDANFWMSGCKCIDCKQPTIKEGVIEQTFTYQPKNCGVIVRLDATAGSAPA